ncbi:hypothetical protein AVEN_68423-1, partial [Araneus ventricosus]
SFRERKVCFAYPSTLLAYPSSDVSFDEDAHPLDEPQHVFGVAPFHAVHGEGPRHREQGHDPAPRHVAPEDLLGHGGEHVVNHGFRRKAVQTQVGRDALEQLWMKVLQFVGQQPANKELRNNVIKSYDGYY